MHAKKIIVSNYVKFYRKQNDLTQMELGALVGKSDKTISTLESFHVNPSFDTCTRLARVFGLEVSELFFEKGKAPERRIALIEKA